MTKTFVTIILHYVSIGQHHNMDFIKESSNDNNNSDTVKITTTTSSSASLHNTYDKWSKYNIDEALENIDVQESIDERERQREKTATNELKDETNTASTFQEEAEILSSQAAVSRFRSKRRRGKKKNKTKDMNNNNNKLTKNNNNNEQETQMLKMANLYNFISKNIKSIREKQEECKQIMEQDEDKKYEKVNNLSTQSYELVTKGINQVKDMLPANEVKDEKIILDDNNHDVEDQRSNGHGHSHGHSHGHDHGHDHGHGSSCSGNNHSAHDHSSHKHSSHAHSHDSHNDHKKCNHHNHDETKSKKISSSTKKNDDTDKKNNTNLKTALKVLLRLKSEILINLGLSTLHLNMLPSSVEYLKDAILLREKSNNAWKYRGHAYLKMFVPHLAILHFNRALTMNQDDVEAVELLKIAKEDSLARNTRSRDDQLKLETSYYVKNHTQKIERGKIWENIKYINELGVVLFIEEYFESASIKFEIALTEAETLLRFLNSNKNDNMEETSNMIKFILESFNNIATCYFKCSTNSSMHKAIEYCTLGIEKKVDDMSYQLLRANLLYRRAQSYNFLYSFNKSENDLLQAKTILAEITTNNDANEIDTGMDEKDSDVTKLLSKVERFISFIRFRMKQFGNIDV